MFSYYGSKTKICDKYPKPKGDLIIEPFAGAAKYSLLHFEKEVILVDKYRELIEIWKWLQQCSPKDILRLPILKMGETIEGMDFGCEGANYFMGFMVGRGLSRPQYKVSPFVGSEKQYHFQYTYKRIASELYKIKHWKFICDDYRNIDNQEATWFVDPPYQYGGQKYKHSSKNIDFKELAAWCKSRKGQVIVCENTKANWMDFKPVTKITGCNHKTTEAIWSNVASSYDNVQLSFLPTDHEAIACCENTLNQ